MKRIGFIVGMAIQNMWRHKGISFPLLVSLGFVFLLFGLFVLIYTNAQSVVEAASARVQVSLYLSHNANEKQVQNLKTKLTNDPRITSFNYISKKEASNLFKQSFQDPSLTVHLKENPLPASFDLSVVAALRTPQKIVWVIDDYKSLSGVEAIDYSAEWLEILHVTSRRLTSVGRYIGGWVAIAVMTVAVIVLRLHFNRRREETNVLELIGADNVFIKLPVLIEGATIGTLSTAVSLAALWGVYQVVLITFQRHGHPVPLSAQFLHTRVMLGMVASGCLLGAVGSISVLTRTR